MNQLSLLSRMFDFSIVVNKLGEIVQSYSNDETFSDTISMHKSFTSFEEAIFQQSIFDTLDPVEEKQNFMQKTWNNQRVLTYVIPHNDILFFGYNLLEKTIHTIEDSPQFKHAFMYKSPAMHEVIKKITKAASTGVTTLLLGESGVGKELAARTIYQESSRKGQPFVAINCGAIPETLIESELFGYTAGSFTGAQKSGKIGKFREAHKGIIFLDEIGELPLSMQVKLLRVLQEKVVTPIGSSTETPIDVQVIAATNKSLQMMVKEGTFREDLYYRLNIIPIVIPPLRDRAIEIPDLIEKFTQTFNEKYNLNKYFSTTAIDFLCIQEWQGNVRELENFVERVIILSDEDVISLQVARNFTTPSNTPPNPQNIIFNQLMPLQEAQEIVEEKLITMAMEKYNSLKLAANVLGISQPTMSRKYKKIKESNNNEQTIFSTRSVLENELNKRLRSTAVVTSVSISPNLLENAIANPDTPHYLSLVSDQLTQVYNQEEGVVWGFIFVKNEKGQFTTLTASADFPIKQYTPYEGSEISLEAMNNAMNGTISVTPVYEDELGEWKTCCAPLYDTSGKIVAIIGFDYSKDYVNSELIKLSESLNIKLQ